MESWTMSNHEWIVNGSVINPRLERSGYEQTSQGNDGTTMMGKATGANTMGIGSRKE